MKLALHRSIVFWSGLLVMTFVCWAWWYSWRASTLVETKRWTLTSVGSGLLVNHEDAGTSAWVLGQYGYRRILLPRPRFRRYEQGAAAEGPVNPAWNLAEQMMYRHGRPGDWICFVPYWLIFLAVAAAWLFLLFLRARRRNKSVITS